MSIDPAVLYCQLGEQRYAAFLLALNETNFTDAAALLEELSPRRRLAVLRLLPIETAVEIFCALAPAARQELLPSFKPKDRPYIQTGVRAIYLRRIPWLLLLMISATFTGGIIRAYESALQAAVVLSSFIPMLMDTGGNAGGQAAVTVIRAMSLGEINFRDLGRILFKELRVGLLCGMTLGAVAFVKVFLFDRSAITPDQITATATVVALSLFFAILVAKLVGSSLPILARRLGFDPAVMASPFITTIVDAVALTIYFAIATVMLGI